MAPATLDTRSLVDVPQKDVTSRICASEKTTVGRALQRADVLSVASKNSDAVASNN